MGGAAGEGAVVLVEHSDRSGGGEVDADGREGQRNSEA
jgi:hypothetical protein